VATVYEKKLIIRGIVSAVSYLHREGISHGDLKPENIVLMKDGGVKLIDFGYCKEMQFGLDSDKWGTLAYASPELLRRGIYDTRKADSWSLGILLFVITTKTFPYASSHDDLVRGLILRGQLLSSVKMGGDLIALYRGLTNPSPKERLSAVDVLHARCLSVSEVKYGSVKNGKDCKVCKDCKDRKDAKRYPSV
jgi:serine/threonine protein kinase